MEILKQLGFTEAEINGTIEEQTQAFERIKQGIVDNVVNDPKNYNAIAEKTKFEALKIAEKTVAKALGVTIEQGDDLKVILQKGKDFLSTNNETVLKELQDKTIALSNKITEYDEEIIPSIRKQEQSKVHNVFMGNDFRNTLKKDKFKGITLAEDDALIFAPIKFQSLGWVSEYDETSNKTIVKTKDGLRPQLNNKTFEHDDLEGILGAVLDSYIPKSNGGAQGGAAGQGGAGFQNQGAGGGTGHVLSPAAQKLADELAKVKV